MTSLKWVHYWVFNGLNTGCFQVSVQLGLQRPQHWVFRSGPHWEVWQLMIETEVPVSNPISMSTLLMSLSSCNGSAEASEGWQLNFLNHGYSSAQLQVYKWAPVTHEHKQASCEWSLVTCMYIMPYIRVWKVLLILHVQIKSRVRLRLRMERICMCMQY